MPTNPNKLSRFWQELKRRRVVHVITVYASATFVIIELINNLTEPLNLPSNLLTIVVIVLAVGFPLAIILSWLYDVTSEGMEKTKPIEEVKEGEKTVVPNAWKIATYVSFVVIVGLLTFNIIGGTKSLKAGDIQSLVVLPFDNYTGDDQLENMVSGMHALLVGDMGRISGVRILGTKTSNVYKDVDMSATGIASELNVDAVLEASVMCLGDSVCMQFRLVRTTGDEEQLWIADYKVDKSQAMNLYNQLTKQIADEIMIELAPEEERIFAKSRTVDREAYDAYVRSYQYWGDLSLESLNKALESLNLAIEKDPDFAPSYAGLAQVWVGLAQMGFVAPDVAGPKIFENINKALELAPDFTTSHFVNGIIAVWTEWDWEKGETEFKKALAINPSDAMARIYYAHLLMILQRFDEALIQGRIAVELDPKNPLILALFAPVLISVEEWENALGYLEDALKIDPTSHFALGFFDLVAYRCKEFEKAFEALKMTMPFEDDVKQDMEEIFREQGIEAVYEELNHLMEIKAQKEFVSFFEFAVRYMILNQNDKALDWFETGLQFHNPNMPYITTGFFNTTQLNDNPRFIAILEKMNLPLPKN